ncbi:ATP-dependent translocase ABCB1 [Lamellibrachia satsuma]|nr:ATP-dependent translocase ABCB1 [Lamellibrachia satsuma]
MRVGDEEDTRLARNDMAELTHDETGDKPSKPEMVSVKKMFRFTTRVDFALMLIGFVSAIVQGAVVLLVLILFGDMIDSFVTNEQDVGLNYTTFGLTEEQVRGNPGALIKALQDHNMSTDIDSKMDIIQLRFMDRMQEIALYYIAVGGIAMVAGYLQTGCWLLTSSRQAHQARHALLRAILNQNVGWFDTQDVRQFNNRLVDDVNKFEEGVGDKLGHFFQDTTTFVTGFVIGFIYSWKLCLVIFGFTPFLVASGIFLNHMLTGMTGKELDSYARAAAVAEEVIASVRTVVAYGGERKEVNRQVGQVGGTHQDV